jgi:RNA polymerase sigma factor (sigma-70 family)
VPSNAEQVIDDRDEVVRMLATLPPQQRRVIVLRYYNDLSEADVADHLGISVGAVKSAASRGLATLRTQYAPIAGGGQ